MRVRENERERKRETVEEEREMREGRSGCE